MEASERVLRAHLQAALLLVSEDSRQNFHLMVEAVSIAQNLDGFDAEKLRAAAAYLIDTIECVLMGVDEYNKDPRWEAVTETFTKMRQDLAAA